MAYIELKHIDKTYGNKKVLNDISLAIEQGEFIALLGASGCGKTTLLRALAGLDTIDRGQILIGGANMTFAKPSERNINMIFQQYSLFPTMTVYKNIAFGLKMQKCPKSEIDARVQEALAMVEMLGSEQKYPSQLSGGEQQRVALARAIVTQAKILLLDEPFSAIDAKLRKSLQLKIRDIHDKLGLTSIFVTHDQEEAARISDRIYLLHDGQIEQTGTPSELYTNPKTLYVAGFMGNCNVFDEKTPWAIRPEVISLSATPWSASDEVILESGIIRRLIHQGNIIRYTVDTSLHPLEVDVLADNTASYHVGETVYLRYDRSHIKTWRSSVP